jgi:hypothetical protein
VPTVFRKIRFYALKFSRSKRVLNPLIAAHQFEVGDRDAF